MAPFFLFLGGEIGLGLKEEWHWCYWWSKFCNYYGPRLYVVHQCSTLQVSQLCWQLDNHDVIVT